MNTNQSRAMFSCLRSLARMLAVLLFVSVLPTNAQNIYDWLDTAPDGNWMRGADGARWSDGSWDAPLFGILRFNNNNQLTMTNNVPGTYSQHGMVFGSSNTSTRTIGGNTVRLYDYGDANPYIENASSGSHVINFSLGATAMQ